MNGRVIVKMVEGHTLVRRPFPGTCYPRTPENESREMFNPSAGRKPTRDGKAVISLKRLREKPGLERRAGKW